MASPTPVTVPATVELPDLLSIDSDGRAAKILIVGFNIAGDRAVPVFWPAPPGPVFIRASGSFRRMDLTTGLATGPSFASLAEVPK